MWLLIHIATEKKYYLLNDRPVHSVGRSGDISLDDGDQSISRMHANLYVYSDRIEVEDECSKYGVFVNRDIETNKPIKKKTRVELTSGDIVRFGRCTNSWRLENVPITCCSSTLSVELIDELKRMLSIVNGQFVCCFEEDITHLVVPTVMMTEKVLYALICGKHIVSMDYWREYIKCAKNNESLPNVEDFMPELKEEYLINNPSLLRANSQRRRLFKDKTFLFMTQKRMKRFEKIIHLAGGKCLSLDKTVGFRKTDLLKTQYIPVRYSTSTQSQGSQVITNITSLIITNGRRLIAEDEIGLAIFHSTIEQFCNPDKHIASNFEVSTVDLTDDAETMRETPTTNNFTENPVYIPESIDLTDETNSEPVESATTSSSIEKQNNASEAENHFNLPDENQMHSMFSESSKRKTSEEPELPKIAIKRRKIEDQPSDTEQTATTSTSVPDDLSQTYSQSSGFISSRNRSHRSMNNNESPKEKQNSSMNKTSGENEKKNTKRVKIERDLDDFEFDFMPSAKKTKKEKQTKTENEKITDSFEIAQPKIVSQPTPSSSTALLSTTNSLSVSYKEKLEQKLASVEKIADNSMGFIISKFKAEINLDESKSSSIYDLKGVRVLEDYLKPNRNKTFKKSKIFPKIERATFKYETLYEPPFGL